MNRIFLKIDASDFSNAEFLTKAVQGKIPNFEWTYDDYSLEEWDSLIGVYKVAASKDSSFKGDSNWPVLSVFLKDSKKKDLVWADIQSKLIPFLTSKQKKLEEIVITGVQLQKILSKITDSNFKFSLDLPDGRFLSVNKDPSEGLSEDETIVSSSDLSSMLAAVWLFNSKGIRLPS
jgi:hypothetical protein